jgi:hypothetical protein
MNRQVSETHKKDQGYEPTRTSARDADNKACCAGDHDKNSGRVQHGQRPMNTDDNAAHQRKKQGDKRTGIPIRGLSHEASDSLVFQTIAARGSTHAAALTLEGRPVCRFRSK